MASKASESVVENSSGNEVFPIRPQVKKCNLLEPGLSFYTEESPPSVITRVP